ncbi:MAG: hypothetical protein JW884_00900 [Deltaproteobacteria bacterium]|nr:hypothetical protein [Deltaproteobacteria bacterium]
MQKRGSSQRIILLSKSTRMAVSIFRALFMGQTPYYPSIIIGYYIRQYAGNGNGTQSLSHRTQRIVDGNLSAAISPYLSIIAIRSD